MLILYPALSWGGNLTQETAQIRREIIDEVSYDIKLEFFKSKDFFKGMTSINATLKKLDRPLEIDLTVSEVNKVIINGVELKKFDHQQGRLVIPPHNLSLKMKIDIEYTANFIGMGFRYFIDPNDKSEYFYTSLQPYLANNVFPCFDQPDIKARMSLTVIAPGEWKVVGNGPIINKVVEQSKTISSFKTTPPISTYLFFVGGGDMVEIKDKSAGIPLSIYVRKNLLKHVDQENIFALTRKGLKFFEEYFSYPYPFSKYDYFFAPDFGVLGMENPGAVTLNEQYIFQGQVPRSLHLKREEVIMHEMAHMWFGNLVTMRWWDDLWLNESFATYMAGIAQERGLGSKDGWLHFLSLKKWGYHEDSARELVLPVIREIPDTFTSESSFDGITYTKGAASLKQLHFYVGEEAFKKGLQKNFKKFAYKNTSLNDFLSSIDDFTPKDIKSWMASWLQTAGIHEITPQLECSQKKILSFSISQSANSGKHYSPHRTMFGFYRKTENGFELISTPILDYQAGTTAFPELTGTECPDFILPNYKDYDYGYFKLGEESLKYSLDAIGKLPDTVGRLSLWITLELALRNGEVSPWDFFQYVQSSFRHETSPEVISLVIGIQQSRFGIFKDPFFAYLTKEERKKISRELESIVFNRFLNTRLSSNERMVFFELYLLVSGSALFQKRIYNFLKTNKGISGIKLSQELRWKIIRKLASLNHPKAMQLIALESERDKSFDGRVNSFAAQVSFPDLKSKSIGWEAFLNPQNHPYTVLKSSSEFIYNGDHPGLNLPFLKPYFEKIANSDWQKFEPYIDLYFHELFPLEVCSQEVVEMSEKYFKKSKTLTPYAKKRWQMVHEDLKRCVLARNL